MTYNQYEVIHGVQLTHYLKDDANQSNKVGETRNGSKQGLLNIPRKIYL